MEPTAAAEPTFETTAPEKWREIRGRQIARAGKIRRVGRKYVVPSQTRGGDVGSYLVDVSSDACTCPDHTLRGVRCKHVEAVFYAVLLQSETDADGTVTETVTIKRKTYRQSPAYTTAQVHEKERVEHMLRALCDGIVEPPRNKVGRPRKSLRDKVFAAVDKALRRR